MARGRIAADLPAIAWELISRRWPRGKPVAILRRSLTHRTGASSAYVPRHAKSALIHKQAAERDRGMLAAPRHIARLA
jgi:hypothetical protein